MKLSMRRPDFMYVLSDQTKCSLQGPVFVSAATRAFIRQHMCNGLCAHAESDILKPDFAMMQQILSVLDTSIGK